MLQYQFLRFLLVGCGNTAFSYSLYAGFLWLGLPYALANLLAFVISLLVGFRTQGALVFRNRDKRLVGRYVLSWCLIFLFNIGLIGCLMRWGLSSYAAGAVALVPVTLLSYGIQKFVVFESKRARDLQHVK